MAIYEVRGFGNSLHLYTGRLTPFDYIANFKPMTIPNNTTTEQYKRHLAPYCISGQIQPNLDGAYMRNNANLSYRDLLFLDYDTISSNADTFKQRISTVLKSYSYILYPTINHTAEIPRYRLVVKPSQSMNETSYKATLKELSAKIGIAYDLTSLTWSQLQGLPVTRDNIENYDKVINYGKPYPVVISGKQELQHYEKTKTAKKSITMRVLDTLLHGYGEEGRRNITATSFIGLLLNKYIDCDVKTAYELASIANSVTPQPLTQRELDTIFKSIVKKEIRKRGRNH